MLRYGGHRTEKDKSPHMKVDRGETPTDRFSRDNNTANHKWREPLPPSASWGISEQG